MKSVTLTHQLITGATILAAAAGAVSVTTTPSVAESYMAGDFHNHTPCSDGRSSVETMVKKSIETYGLEWLTAADHGGSSPRDCRIDDPEGNGSNPNNSSSGPSAGRFFDEDPSITIKGNLAMSGGHRSMWRWQSAEEIIYPELTRLAKELKEPMIFAGVETNVPGHEHTSMAVIGNQKPENFGRNVGDASAVAEFEYRFDRSDTDTSGGAPNHNWTGKVANATGADSGINNHNNKAVPSVRWLQQNFPLDSFYVPAHAERAGVFNPNGNNGFNVEHFRNFNNAGPTVAVGFETQPGHQASNNRGEYRANFCGTGCNSVGVTTFGGTGVYGAKVGGVWDALLGEGRNWFFYASSDWHNRGQFSIYEQGSTNDFYPGEYQKLYIPRPENGDRARPQVVVDGVRSGNSYSVMGDLITGELTYKAELVDSRGHDDDKGGRGHDDDKRGRGHDGDKGRGHDDDRDDRKADVVKMGETLVVPRGKSVRLTLEVNVPKGPNHSPYSFNNPSLAQIGIQEPLNRPTLRNVDFIRGDIAGPVDPSSANYTNATNPSASVIATVNSSTWKVKGSKRTMEITIPNVQKSMYVRVRGSNLPPGTPAETDAQGNPLNDWDPENSAQGPFVTCTDAACPSHMAVRDGVKLSSYDVAAWADLWFYTNPIFIRVAGEPKLLVERNAELAEKQGRDKDDNRDHDRDDDRDHGRDHDRDSKDAKNDSWKEARND